MSRHAYYYPKRNPRERCERCNGDGLPHGATGYGMDLDECPECSGRGWTATLDMDDPLVRMKVWRDQRAPAASPAMYRKARELAMRPNYRLGLTDARVFAAIQQRRMLAAAAACAVMTSALVQKMRAA